MENDNSENWKLERGNSEKETFGNDGFGKEKSENDVSEKEHFEKG